MDTYTVDDNWFVTVTDYYGVFHVVDLKNYTFWYWYKNQRFSDPRQLGSMLGSVEYHNSKCLLKFLSKNKPFYFRNTTQPNIIQRSDGWYRDFGSMDFPIVFPPECDFD